MRKRDIGKARVKKLLTIGSILLCLALPAHAQSDTPAPFDGDLERLAEVMGALHYLRAICGANEGPKWRNEMQSLIDAEAPERRSPPQDRGELQSWLPRIPADLPHMHARRRHCHPAISRRRRKNRP